MSKGGKVSGICFVSNLGLGLTVGWLGVLDPIPNHISFTAGEDETSNPASFSSMHGAQSNLPLVHALLGRIYASQGRTAEAIKQLQQALPDDHDGSFHYQMDVLYKQVGGLSAAREALKQSEALRKRREQRAQETVRAVD